MVIYSIKNFEINCSFNYRIPQEYATEWKCHVVEITIVFKDEVRSRVAMLGRDCW